MKCSERSVVFWTAMASYRGEEDKTDTRHRLSQGMATASELLRRQTPIYPLIQTLILDNDRQNRVHDYSRTSWFRGTEVVYLSDYGLDFTLIQHRAMHRAPVRREYDSIDHRTAEQQYIIPDILKTMISLGPRNETR